jgi:hypothetical protein
MCKMYPPPHYRVRARTARRRRTLGRVAGVAFVLAWVWWLGVV